MGIYTQEQIARELNKVINDRIDTTTRLLRTLLTLAATLLTVLLPLTLFAGLSQPCKICLLCGGTTLFVCCVGCIVGLLVLRTQEKRRLGNLIDYRCNYEEYSQLPPREQARLLLVPDDKRLSVSTTTALICIFVAICMLLAVLFQILLS